MGLMELERRYLGRGKSLITGDILLDLFEESGRTRAQYFSHIKILIKMGLFKERNNWYRNTRYLESTPKARQIFNNAFCVVLNPEHDHEQDQQRIFSEVNLRFLKRIASKQEMADVLAWCKRRINYVKEDFYIDRNREMLKEINALKPLRDSICEGVTAANRGGDSSEPHIKKSTVINILSIVNRDYHDDSHGYIHNMNGTPHEDEVDIFETKD